MRLVVLGGYVCRWDADMHIYLQGLSQKSIFGNAVSKMAPHFFIIFQEAGAF